MADSQTIETILRRYLCLYWLRPETAMWRTCDALAVHDLGLPFFAPTLDLACGDGLNSYVLLGQGDPPLSLDAFLGADSEISKEDFLSGRVDLYDHSCGFQVKVPAPGSQVAVGLDVKKGLLEKASCLKLYQSLVLHDANNKLPFAAGSFASVFSNALYSIPNLRGVLGEINRILRPGGCLIALLTNDNFRRYSMYRLFQDYGWEWCRVLDRGRQKEVEHCYTRDCWMECLQASGLKVRYMIPYLSSRLYQIAEVGLRPISPVLIKLANAVKRKERIQIKREWIEYCMEVAYPMFTSGWLTSPDEPQIYFLAVASKEDELT